MMWKTHLVSGVALGLFAAAFFDVGNLLIFVLILSISTVLPDIDARKSLVAKTIWPFNWLLSFVSKHRGFFHSIYPGILLGFLVYFIGGNITYAYAAFAGYFLHLALDGCTRSGVKPFWPILSYNLRGPIKTRSIFEWAVFLLMVVFGTIYVMLITFH